VMQSRIFYHADELWTFGASHYKRRYRRIYNSYVAYEEPNSQPPKKRVLPYQYIYIQLVPIRSKLDWKLFSDPWSINLEKGWHRYQRNGNESQ
jgi:hypothetical protein